MRDFPFCRSPETLYIFVISILSSKVKSGRIEGRRLASIVLPLPGCPLRRISVSYTHLDVYKRQEMTHAVLKKNGVFDYIDAFVYCDQVGKNKAFPDVYEAAAKALGLKASECYIFEDVPYALEGAKKSGAEVIGVFDEYSASKEAEMRSKADRYIMSLEEFRY